MRWIGGLVALLLIASAVSAGPANGGNLTPTENTLHLFADADSDEMWMSTATSEPNMYEGNYGRGGLTFTQVNALGNGGYTYLEYPMAPAPSTDILLDTSQDLEMTFRFGASGGGGVIQLTPTIFVNQEVFIVGEQLTTTYGAGYTSLSWKFAPTQDTIPADANVTLALRFDGLAYGVFVDVSGDDQSYITLPVLPNEESGEAAESPAENSTAPSETEAPEPSQTEEPKPSEEPEPSAEPEPSSDPGPTSSLPAETVPVQDTESDKGTPGAPLALAILAFVGLAIVRRKL